MPGFLEDTHGLIQKLASSYSVSIVAPGTDTERIENLQQMVGNIQDNVVGSKDAFLHTTASTINNAIQGYTRAAAAFNNGDNARGGAEIARSLSTTLTPHSPDGTVFCGVIGRIIV
jgi:hypothetical protein